MCNFLCYFKNKNLSSEDIAQNCFSKIDSFSKEIKQNSLNLQYEDNFFTILGYSYRIDDISQRLYFTFQEAILAVDLEKMMGNNEGIKLNTIVYILVLEVILKEYISNEVDLQQKQKALNSYKKIEEQKAKENKKYHMYQY